MIVRASQLLLVVMVSLIAIAARAQVPPVDQLQRPREVPLPTLEPEVKPPALKLPPPPSPGAPALSQGIRVHVREFRFVGNSVVSDEELQAIATPYAGREIGNLELDDLRLRLTRRYTDAGYINSGAVLPDQDVSEGVVTYRIVEGRLSAIALGGSHRYDPEFLRARIGSGAEGVLNINRLQERLQVLLQDPLIERIAAELAPGVAPGEAVLRAEVTSAPLFLAGFSLANDRSPSIGADQLEGLFAVRNLLGRGEVLALRPAKTEGLEDYGVGLSLPLTARGLTLNLRAQRTRSRVVEAPLDQLDIGANSKSYEAGLSYPLIAAPRRSLNVNAFVAKRSTDSLFLGQPSPFIPGEPDGRTTVSVLRLGIDGVDRTPQRVLAGRLQVSHGLDAFGATVAAADIPDSKFTAMLAQLQWVQRIAGDRGQLLIRGELQKANDNLLGPEKYSVGGIDSVRGYRRDLLVRDNGWLGSLEYRHRLARVPLRAAAGADEGTLQLVVFADTGQAWDHDSPAGVQRVSSVGTGVRWEPVPGVDAQALYGHALNNVSTPTRTSQDRGIHLRLSVARAF
jgi:hemolysin activation/secretion protein